jgi:AraC-like DNA-binding protein
MRYQEFKPSKQLEPFVKCYYTMQCDADFVLVDTAFATACLEVMFTLDGSPWQTLKNGNWSSTTKVELWGQVLKPLPLRAQEGSVFGIRFHPASASLFLTEDVHYFNDSITSLEDVLGNRITNLHEGLVGSASLKTRINLVEDFLIRLLERNEKGIKKVNLIAGVMQDLAPTSSAGSISTIASNFGISSRYLQRTFFQHTGLTPKLYGNIARFQKSLTEMNKQGASLTDVAYESGYFDQSHFVREFKRFTGVTPSSLNLNSSTAILAGL